MVNNTQTTDSKSGGAFGGVNSGSVFNGDVVELDSVTYSNHAFSDVAISKNQSTDSKSGQTSENWNVAFSLSNTDSKSGNTLFGNDIISIDVERLVFTDTSLALDLDVGDRAGTAVALLYAAFDDMPDADVLGKWITQSDKTATPSKQGGLDDQHSSNLAQTMIDHYAPQGIDNSSLVSLLYTNIIGDSPSSNVLAGFVNQIDSGAHTQASFFAMAAETDFNTNQYVDLIGTGLKYTPDDSKTG